MPLTLYIHPISSFCHKALIAFYENDIPFQPRIVDLLNPVSRDQFRKVWSIGKLPVLCDAARNRTIPESTIIIEYLQQHYPGRVRLIPDDPDLVMQVRATDRFYDQHVHQNMQKLVLDKVRPADARDPFGVEQARDSLRTALRIVEGEMADRQWAAGEQFSLADCAAAPPLFYIDKMMPLQNEFPHLRAYLGRLMERPSYARAISEAQPYLGVFPS